MHFWILYNNGSSRYVKARTNALGEEVAARLKTIRSQGRIRDFKPVEFEKISPDDILKTE